MPFPSPPAETAEVFKGQKEKSLASAARACARTRDDIHNDEFSKAARYESAPASWRCRMGPVSASSRFIGWWVSLAMPRRYLTPALSPQAGGEGGAGTQWRRSAESPLRPTTGTEMSPKECFWRAGLQTVFRLAGDPYDPSCPI